jgi:hypothetical protein
MKLNIVPPRMGIEWVKLGIKTFLKQPMALAGLFFMFMAAMVILSLVPFVGAMAANCLFPVVTVGLMAATQQAAEGKFPMPSLIIHAFRGNQKQVRALLLLGAVFAVSCLAVVAVSSLIDDGKFAERTMQGGNTIDAMQVTPDMAAAIMFVGTGFMILIVAFSQAAALVFWHDAPALKSLFFSVVGCLRNVGAFVVFGLAWMAVISTVSLVVMLVSGLLGGPDAAVVAMFPAAMLLSAMFFTSLFFIFQSSFSTSEITEGPPP